MNLQAGYEHIPDTNISSKDCYEDVISQHIDKHFNFNHKLPIESNPFIPSLPKSYVDYSKSILRTLQPQNLISANTGSMIIDVFRDMVGGGYISLDLEDNKLERRKSLHTHDIINKTLKNTETFGHALVYRTEEELFIKNATEFYYDETNHILYTSSSKTIDNEDTYIHTMRYVSKYRGQPYIYEESTIGNVKQPRLKIQPNLLSDDPLTQMLAVIVTNNPYNEDWVGISAIDSVQQQLQGFELTLHEYNKAMYFTSPRTFMLSSAVEVDENGKPTVDLTNDTYVVVDGISQDNPTNLVQTSQYKFDALSFRTKLTDDLNIILSKVGLDQKVIATSGTSIERSATEIVSEDNRMYATIENRRSQYHSQFEKLVKLINFDSKDIGIRYIPIQSFNMQMVTQTTTQKKSLNLISQREAIIQLNPRFTEEQIENELKLIKQDMQEAQLGSQSQTYNEDDDENYNSNDNIGIDNNAENRDRDGYNTSNTTGKRRGPYNT